MPSKTAGRRRKRSAGWPVVLGVLSAWLLSGCITTLLPAKPLPREALASVTEVALAVGDDGVKHYVWSECSGSEADYTCVLVYTRTATGGVIYSHAFVEPIGNFVQSPDVAVTSSGDAYVVRSVCTGFLDCIDYWSLFPADPDGVFIDTLLLHTSAVKSQGPPLVEARGEDVYAAYYTDLGGETRLRYRQLGGGSRLGLIDTSNLLPSDVSLAVDADGDLHAAWVRKPVTDTAIAYSHNKGAAGNFAAAATFDASSDHLLTQPDVALDSEDRPYIAYAINDGLDDTVVVRCIANLFDCYRDATLLTVPQVDGPWNVWRSPKLEMIGLQPNVVFAAIHDSLTFNEVWWYHPPSAGGDVEPTRVTNTTNANEGEPLIVKENSTAGDVAVIGWRMYEALVQAGNAPSAGFCYGDVFVTFSSTANTRQVFEDRGTCGNSGFDLAANGAWVAGVWTDEESAQIQSHAAWTSFNTLRVGLPVVAK